MSAPWSCCWCVASVNTPVQTPVSTAANRRLRSRSPTPGIGPVQPRARSRSPERRLRAQSPVHSNAKGIRMSKPTIVLVHGAFGDASSWRGAFHLLDGGEYSLLAAALPLRGVAADIAYLDSVIEQLDGPIILAGHSYAGSVITVAGVS